MREQNVENLVFDAIADMLRANYEGIYVTGELPASLAKFPAVSLRMTSASVVERDMTDSDIEHTVLVGFEARVYSNKTSGKKQEAGKIMGDIDDSMAGLNFRKSMSSPVDNLADSKIYQLVNRYTAKVVQETTGEDINYWIFPR